MAAPRWLAGAPLSLTERERALLDEFLGRGLAGGAPGVRDGGVPAWLSTRSVFGTIFFQSTVQFAAQRDTAWARGLLVHESVHVWQYRTVGARYAAGALWDQLRFALATGTRRGAYVYELEEGRPFVSYGFEQQAQILQDHYLELREAVTASRRRYCRNLTVLGETRARAIAERHREWVCEGRPAR
jgi:hypothetical protein